MISSAEAAHDTTCGSVPVERVRNKMAETFLTNKAHSFRIPSTEDAAEDLNALRRISASQAT
jgi:hypothetical protein